MTTTEKRLRTPRAVPHARSLRGVFGNSGWTLAGSLVTAVLGFTATVIVPRLLGPSLVGVYFLTLSVTGFATAIGLLGMPLTITRVLAGSVERDTGLARAAIRRGAAVALAGAGCTAAVCLAGGWSLVARHVFSSPGMANVSVEAGALIFIASVMTFAVGAYRGLHKQAIAAAYDGPATNVLYVVALVLLLIVGAHPSLKQLLLVLIAAGALAVVPATVGLAKQARTFANNSGSPLPALLRIGAPVMLISLMTNVVVGAASDLWVLGAFRPTTSVALYGAAVMLTGVVGMPFSALTVAIGPTIAGLATRGDRAEMERVIRSATTVVFLPTAFVVIGLSVGAGPLLSGLFGSFYGNGAWILASLSVAVAINAATGPWGMALIMTGNQRTMLKLTALTGAACVCADLFAAPRWGATGVAVASSSAISLMHLLGMIVARKHLGFWTGVRTRRDDLHDGIAILRNVRSQARTAEAPTRPPS